MQLAKARFSVDGNMDNIISLADARVAVAKAEVEKANAQLGLALKRSHGSEGDDKTRCEDFLQNYRNNIRIAAENLSCAHEEKKNLRQECICSTHVESPAEGLKRKADMI